jgi:hypothetical protein
VIVSRAQGLSFLRAEKAWRPIVTIDFDHHPQFEACLGCNGENPNQKMSFPLSVNCFRFTAPELILVIVSYTTGVDSKLDIKVWHRSPSKKKRKINIVASTTVTLAEILRKQDSSMLLFSPGIKGPILTSSCRERRRCPFERVPLNSDFIEEGPTAHKCSHHLEGSTTVGIPPRLVISMANGGIDAMR